MARNFALEGETAPRLAAVPAKLAGVHQGRALALTLTACPVEHNFCETVLLEHGMMLAINLA